MTIVALIPKPFDPNIECDDSHITSVYFGDDDLPEDLFNDLVEAVRWAIADNQIFRQTVEPLGFDYFGENADYPVLRLKDNGSLEKFRNSILEHCSPELKQVFEENETYPEYKPHITLKKIGEELPEEIELEYIQIWNEEEAWTMAVFILDGPFEM